MDFQKLMQQAQKMQEEMQKKQVDLGKQEIIGEAGAGLVKITRNGHGDALKIEVDPSITSGMSKDDREMLLDLVLAAFNDSERKKHALSQESMSALGSGLDLGGLGDIGKLFK